MAVTPEVIAVRLEMQEPSPSSTQWASWEMLIADAYMLIEDRRAELDADEPVDAKLDYVVREAVAAHIKNPDDATQVTISVDDASSSRSYRSGRGRVAISDDWWRFLGLTDPVGAFSVDMVGAGIREHWPWCWSLTGASCTCGAP